MDNKTSVIGPHTRYTGSVEGADKLIIEGTCQGEILNTECVEIMAKGMLKGIVRCNEISIHKEGCFSGNLETKKAITEKGSRIEGKIKVK